MDLTKEIFKLAYSILKFIGALALLFYAMKGIFS